MNRGAWHQSLESFIFENASLQLFGEMADDSLYWNSAYEFVDECSSTPMGDLSDKQYEWAQKIKRDLERMQ